MEKIAYGMPLFRSFCSEYIDQKQGDPVNSTFTASIVGEMDYMENVNAATDKIRYARAQKKDGIYIASFAIIRSAYIGGIRWMWYFFYLVLYGYFRASYGN